MCVQRERERSYRKGFNEGTQLEGGREGLTL